MKFLTLSALGFAALGLAGCSATEQNYPTTAQISPAQMAQMEADVKAPIYVAARTPLAAGDVIVPFSLPDTNGKTVKVGDWDKSRATVIMFVSTQCPVSNAYNARMEKLAVDYGARGVKFVGINSNKSENSAAIAEHSRKNGFTFAVLKDKGNVIADRFDARATPETYVVNGKGELVYHGQIDNSQTESEVKSRPLAAALDAVLAGKPVSKPDVAAFGCSIKREN